ncbi:flagellar hook-length control protein FliK [Sphingomonas sp. OTU376]|uniref:flagellar hook-length control protein FliK n=1 Tax=Sphingomonas sp. OTU376 TaxID=3043863 RepID=UPI00313EEB82
MQINTIGSPTGLFGAGGAIPAAGGIGFAALLGAPANPAASPANGLTPPLAANDTLAPATPLSMAQLLTTAAPLAPAACAPVAMPEAPLDAAAPTAAAPVVQLPTEAQPEADMMPVPVAAPVTAEPAAPAPTGDKPSAPIVDAKPAAGSKPVLAEPAPEPGVPAKPQGEAEVEVQAEQPADAPKIPVKRGSRQTDGAEKQGEIDPAATPDAAPLAGDMAAVAIAQAPVRGEVAVKPQPSATRQIGEVTIGGRKADAARTAAFDTPGTNSATVADKASGAVSAITGKQGKNDNAASGDERGQAPAFTLRQDAAPSHAAPTHAATDPARAQTAPAAVAAEPVVVARPGHLGQQMGVEIARKVEAGEDTLRVRLSPDNLGKVEVTLSFDDGGKLHATVRAESTHALDLLRQDMPDLGRSLDQAGIRTDAQSFRFESRSEGGNAQSQQQQGQNASGNQLAGNDETDTNDTAYRSIRGDGQVDLLA